jgi:hypothetical protein
MTHRVNCAAAAPVFGYVSQSGLLATLIDLVPARDGGGAHRGRFMSTDSLATPSSMQETTTLERETP